VIVQLNIDYAHLNTLAKHRLWKVQLFQHWYEDSAGQSSCAG